MTYCWLGHQMCHKNPVATATAPVSMTTSRHVNVARSHLMGEETRLTKKIEAWPLLATPEWCRSYPARIGTDFTIMTAEKQHFDMNITNLLTCTYSVCPHLCRIWSTASCTVTNSRLLGMLSEKKPAVSSCSTTHADRWPQKKKPMNP